MKFIYITVLLLYSCSSTTNEVNNLDIIKCLSIADNYKNTEALKSHLLELDKAFTNYNLTIDTCVTLTNNDVKIMKGVGNKAVIRILKETENLNLDLSDFERIDIIDRIKTKTVKQTKYLAYVHKKLIKSIKLLKKTKKQIVKS
ncbi:hypothetical protein [Olleya sp. R77988]|uniref:hypothetical protein n=1 Tax=Olleya sp. R77988 TaxID=3093875 RepID=UPI0037CB8FF5